MKRIFSNLFVKSLGLPGIDGYAEQNLALFYDANEISQPELDCYKLDRVPNLQHLFSEHMRAEQSTEGN